MSYAFVDTSGWYALVDKNDANNDSAVQFKNTSQDKFVTSNYIVAETITLIGIKFIVLP